MTRKTDEERLKELEKKIEQIKVQKQQVESRLKEKQRKERTRRLIQVGAIFEKYFDISDVDQAEKIAFALKKHVENNKEKILSIDLEKYKEKADCMEKEG
jgi:hypothetical protein